MLSWLKNFLKKDEIITQETGKIVDPIQEELTLSTEIQKYLEENGPKSTLSMLINKLSQGLNGKDAGPVFSEYYAGHFSKKDILDRYEELVEVDLDVLAGIKKLGKYYTPELASSAIGQTEESAIYSATFINEFVQCLAADEFTIKTASTKLWKFYFNYVKEFLDIAKKIGIKPEEYVPRDEIEATILMLLKAERKQKSLE